MSYSKVFVLGSLFVFSVVAAYFAWHSQYINQKQAYFLSKLEELRISYEIIDDSYLRTAKIVYEDHINQPEILGLLKQANSDDEIIRDSTRQKLYEKLLPLYERLKKRDVRQLHFHLPNCDSFLRFHRPSKFGDNLKRIRYSLVKANSELIPVRGFEEGRIKNGFRYVFPVFSNEQHLGSVEISLNFSAIKKHLIRLFKKEYAFILHKSVIEEKVFQSEKSFYKQSPICADFVVEKNNEISTHQEAIHKNLHFKIHDKLASGLGFVESLKSDGLQWLVVFMPVHNVEGKQVAYIVSYLQDATIHKTYISFLINMLVTLTFLAIIFVAFCIISFKNEKLAIARQKAEEESRTKSDFLANMSHEIRTPMNGILGMARLAIDMKPGKEQRKILANVLYSSKSLLGILNDILDISKIEAGQLSLVSQDFNLHEMLENLISTLSFQAKEKNIFLENKTDFTSIPLYVEADDLRLRQILVNLIGNAIKFTTKGGVTFTVKKIKEVDNRLTLNFSILDTGIGLDPSKQTDVFSSFTQADNSTARKYGGTGLGLSISEQLVKMMGGTIGVKSTEGKGSHFFFTIDILRGEMKPEPAANQASSGSKHQDLSILLVEDNEINQDLATIILERDGQRVTVVENGLQSLRAVSEKNFDMIFMDMQMPVMDGVTATTIIRGCEAGQKSYKEIPKNLEDKLIDQLEKKRIPIIAMTANVLERDRKLCLEAGMDAFIGKPFVPKDVYAAINKLPIK